MIFKCKCGKEFADFLIQKHITEEHGEEVKTITDQLADEKVDVESILCLCGNRLKQVEVTGKDFISVNVYCRKCGYMYKELMLTE